MKKEVNKKRNNVINQKERQGGKKKPKNTNKLVNKRMNKYK